MNWQPIETAPRDRSQMLGYNAMLRVPVMVFWYDLSIKDSQWYPCIFGVGELFGDYFKAAWPTHWMPLPEPPVTP